MIESPDALVQLQARYHHCDEAASEECLSPATFVRQYVQRHFARVSYSELAAGYAIYTSDNSASAASTRSINSGYVYISGG